MILRFSGTDDTDFFEQKRTKETKEEFFFVDFGCFRFNSVPRAARMEDSQSVKSVKSVVQFLWLRLAALWVFAAQRRDGSPLDERIRLEKLIV